MKAKDIEVGKFYTIWNGGTFNVKVEEKKGLFFKRFVCSYSMCGEKSTIEVISGNFVKEIKWRNNN